MQDIDSIEFQYLANNRVCPQPMKWNELYSLLPSNQNMKGNGAEASPPLILSAWWHSSDQDKRIRFLGHLKWAEDNDVIDAVSKFLDRLNEEDWYHFGE